MQLRLQFALLVIALLVGCGAEEETGSRSASGGRSPVDSQGGVLIVIDTLRADRLGSYGYPRPTSPRLDALARDGVRFETLVSVSPWTLPSVATMMTSLYPAVHGATEKGTPHLYRQPGYVPASKLNEEHETLAERLQSAGYRTGGFVRGSYPNRLFGIGQGFDHYEDLDVPGLRFLVEDALAWLDEDPEEKFFLYLHVVEVHDPYRLKIAQRPEGYRLDEAQFEAVSAEEQARHDSYAFDPSTNPTVPSGLRPEGSQRDRAIARQQVDLSAKYDGGIRYTDYWMGRFVDGLKERGLYDDTVLIVTSDHGEEFFEHGAWQHGSTFYEEMIRVPLIITGPGLERGSVVERPVGMVDLMPTMLDLLGESLPVGIQGRSLRPIMSGEPQPETLYFADSGWISNRAAARSSRWKYIRSGKKKGALYDLEGDSTEERNVCAERRALCKRMANEVREWERSMQEARRERATLPAEPAILDEATRARLAELGYLDDGAAE